VSVEAFRCWDESNTDEDGAEVYEAYGAVHAAEIFAADEWSNSGGEGTNSFEAHVRCPDGTLHVFTITVEFEPTFSARLKAEPGEAPSDG